MIKEGKKKGTMNDRIHLLESTIINMAESISIMKANQDKLINNQNKIINDLYKKEEESNEVDESQSTGV